MPQLIKNNTLFVILAHMVPETQEFVLFNMADGGHIGFRGQDDISTS
jgi:hypothetical protein